MQIHRFGIKLKLNKRQKEILIKDILKAYWKAIRAVTFINRNELYWSRKNINNKGELLFAFLVDKNKNTILISPINKIKYSINNRSNYKELKIKGNIFVMISDGECQEGTTWESLLIASKHELSNLIIVVDYNKIQALSKIKDALPLDNLRKKFEAFNCN